MKNKIKDLIDLKSIVTLCMTIALTTGFFMGKIDSKDFFVIATMVFTFYFGKPTNKAEDKYEL